MLGKLLKIVSLLMLMALAAEAQTIPAGTGLTVRVGSEISSGTAKAGDRFDATLSRALVVNGKTLARTGAPVRGKVTSAKSSGRLHAPGELTLRLTSVQVNGRMVPIATHAHSVKGKGHTYENWRWCCGRGVDWRVGRWRQRGCDRGGGGCRCRYGRGGGDR